MVLFFPSAQNKLYAYSEQISSEAPDEDDSLHSDNELDVIIEEQVPATTATLVEQQQQPVEVANDPKAVFANSNEQIEMQQQ